jgi:hypothetical protein
LHQGGRHRGQEVMFPPVPPVGAVPGGPSNFPPPAGPSMPGMATGQSQLNSSAIRMAMEIDHALKLLGQAAPAIAPWVEKTTMELKAQLGQILNAPTTPTSPVGSFPDGSSRL